MKMNKKGVMSLRTGILIFIFAITVCSAFIYWAYDGVKHYDLSIESEFNDSFNNITHQISVIHDDSKNVTETLKGLTNDINIQTVIGVPDALLRVIKMPLNYATLFWNVTNEFAKVLHIPGFILLGLEAALLFLLGYLLIDAFLRLKNS